MKPQDEGWSEWFEAAWRYREDVAYRELFGDTGRGIYTLSSKVFLDAFKQPSLDPRWLNCGVFESPPNEKHSSWLYISSGLSNAWEDDCPNPDGVSGLGCEFVFESTEQGRWAINCVQHLVAYQILLGCGRLERKHLVDYFDRIPLGGPISQGSILTWLTITPPLRLPPTFATPSGHVDLLALVGISAEEAQFARERGGEALIHALTEANAYPVTDPRRPCTRSGAGAV